MEKINDAGATIDTATQVMCEQRAKGIAKYGVTIEDAPLSVEQLIRHAQEEMADGLVYTTALAEAFKVRLLQERRALIGEVQHILTTNYADDIKWDRINALVDETPMWITMYVQPSELENHWRTQSNLLTLSRARSFPFTKPVQVRA